MAQEKEPLQMQLIKKAPLEHYQQGCKLLMQHEYGQALKSFSKAAGGGYYLAAMWLHLLYKSPHYAVQNLDKARDWQSFLASMLAPYLLNVNSAADQDRILAMGYLYQHGIARPKDYLQASKRYNHAQLLCCEVKIFLDQFRCELQLAAQDYEEAQKGFKKILDKDPEYVPALFGFAVCQRYQSSPAEVKKAHGCFEKIIQVNPKHHEAWYEWGLFLRAERDYAVALEKFQNAYHLDKNINYVIALIDTLVDLNQNDEAYKLCLQIYAKPPFHPAIFSRLESLNDSSSKDYSGKMLMKEVKGRESKNSAERDLARLLSIPQQPFDDGKPYSNMSLVSDFFQSPKFPECESWISSRHKVSTENCLLFFGCKVAADNKLSWKNQAGLFVERMDSFGRQCLEHYYLERVLSNRVEIQLQKITPQAANQLRDHYYFSLSPLSIDNVQAKEVRIHLRDNINRKTNYINYYSSGMSNKEPDHLQWCDSIVRRIMPDNPTVFEKRLPDAVAPKTCIIS